MPASKRFIDLYDALPPDAQRLLVQKHLVPLLDLASKDRRNRATTSATRLQRRFARMPTLDLKAKKAEMAALLFDLSRDTKRALIKERSRREQLLFDAVDCLAKWLNDIWKVAFEFRTNFKVAHACLLFACEALEHIGSMSGGCKCFYATVFVPVKITRSTGKVVKSFMLNGAHNLENVILWIWRDLFMTILATGTKRQRTLVPDMMDDIRILLGWRALEHLLRGGSESFCDEQEDEEDDEVMDEEPAQTSKRLDITGDDGDKDDSSDDSSDIRDDIYQATFCAPHWSWRIVDQQPQLRDLIHTALLDMFKVAPSAPLYSSMLSIAEDEDELEERLHPILMAAAGHSSDNLAAALRIMSLNNRTESVGALLKSHKHLLRPQDASSLQFAALIMSSNFSYRTHAISIIEEELVDVAKALHAAIRFNFCNIDSENNKAELIQILALGRDSLSRRTRVTRWVKNVVTPQADTPHPMAIAALMIGLPLPPGVDGNDDGDMLGYFEVEGDDPETEDLREEFRPNIKGRLQGWVNTAVAVRGGQALLLRVYGKVIVDMPFFKGSDVVEEMSLRVADRPSKQHVCDGLEAFREFCEKQYLALALAKGKATARRGGGKGGASRAQAGPSTTASGSRSGAGAGSGSGSGSGPASTTLSIPPPVSALPIEGVD